tara:strand:+ start:47 stop:760 length:714 start_codon:yes stop_codon:yes gene_type:complete
MSKNITIEIPETITVGQYQKFGTLDHLSNTERIIRIVSAISGYTEQEVSKWNVANLFGIYKDLNERVESLQAEFLPIFEWEGQTWGFQPLHKMTAGEYIDLEARLKNGVGSLNEVLAILYRPIKEHKFDGLEWKLKHNLKYALGKTENLFKYYTLDDYDVETRSWREEQFKNLPIGLGLGAYNFFLFVGVKYSNDLSTSFQKVVNKMTKEEKKKLNQLLATTDGSILSTTSQKMGES